MEFDRDKYKVYNWKSPAALFWVLNPLTFLLELGVGQRWPRLIVIDKTLPGPETERSIVPCPRCGKLHDVRTWSRQFNTIWKNWFGLYCNHCGGVIPCLLSLSSYIILWVTFPLWTWFEKSFKEQWLKAQPGRFDDLEQKNKDMFGPELWVRTGLAFGAFYLLLITVVEPLIDGEPLSLKHILTTVPFAAILGLGFSFARGTNS